MDGGATQRTVTQQEAEGKRRRRVGGAVSQTGSFMREEARDSQPAPASLLFTDITLYCKAPEPEQGAALVSVGCPVMKVSAHMSTEP